MNPLQLEDNSDSSPEECSDEEILASYIEAMAKYRSERAAAAIQNTTFRAILGKFQ